VSQAFDGVPQTIDEVSTHLREWAKVVAHVSLSPPGGEGVPVEWEPRVSLAPPGEGETPGEEPPNSIQVNVYLLDVVHKPPLRGPGQPPLQVMLRYLVSAWGSAREGIKVAHRALHQLVFAALADPDLEVVEDPIPAALWTAIGTAPRPAFVLRWPLRVEPYERAAPRVRQATTTMDGWSTLHGRLWAPSADSGEQWMPLSGARVELSGGRASATSDRRGFFRLEGVWLDDENDRLLSVRVKGIPFEIPVHGMGTADAPVRIEVPWPTGRLQCQLNNPADKPVAGARIELPDRRQYLITRADGGFVLDGLPENPSLGQVVASQGDATLVPRQEGQVVVLTGQYDPLVKPVVIRFV